MTQKEIHQHYLRLILVTLMWGGTFVAARFIVREVPPFTAAFLRFAIAAAVLWVVMRASEKPPVKISFNQWLLLASLGLTGIFIYNAFFFTGLKYTTAGNGSLVIATNPVLTVIVTSIKNGSNLENC
ncbi:EamA-like transporter family protein [Desulfotomaculum arcticum]|uniref:EamA-like transporter family protein n=1 Tax=Desulfotruncus arcticus DSM 17038 TaxID=1121424 RepID=A0A1I2Y356_9FIRM|nr:DMT family transporter [Desulfotruncus arcticus]SFH18761.1 EamA-like transporter family protein [Desulfotomaculum arcticum] [Desulfotruncus arcticus DSM 17038]